MDEIIPRRSIFTLFPPPHFLEMQAAGISLSEKKIRIILLEQKGRSFFVKKNAEKKIPDGIIVSGEIVKREEFIALLAEVKKELGLQFVSVGLPDEKAYLFKTTLPKSSEDSLQQAVEFKLEENVPIAPSEAVFEAYLLPRPKHTSEHVDVSVCVYPREVISFYTDLFVSAGLVPVSFKAEAEAIARAVLKRGTTETILLVNIGDQKSSVSIVSEGRARFTSIVAVGSETLTHAIERTFNVSTEEALKMKKEGGFVKNKKNEEFFFALVNAISVLKDEIMKVYSYWENHIEAETEIDQKIKRICLTGRDANLLGFAEQIGLRVKLKTEVSNVWVNVSSLDEEIQKVNFEDSLDFASAIGLALSS